MKRGRSKIWQDPEKERQRMIKECKKIESSQKRDPMELRKWYYVSDLENAKMAPLREYHHYLITQLHAKRGEDLATDLGFGDEPEEDMLFMPGMLTRNGVRFLPSSGIIIIG